jgi:hypothetical protein
MAAVLMEQARSVLVVIDLQARLAPAIDGIAEVKRAAARLIRDCQEFRVRAGIVGLKETPHAPTQTACDRRLAA